jgi:hypothetical protein
MAPFRRAPRSTRTEILPGRWLNFSGVAVIVVLLGNELGKLGLPAYSTLALMVERHPENVEQCGVCRRIRWLVLVGAECEATETVSVSLSEVLSKHPLDVAGSATPKPVLRSHFLGAALVDAQLPAP